MKAAAARKQPREDTVLATLNPPFRAEHIGSLLRPQSLLELREKLGRGEIDHAALAQAEDAAIREALALQERVGLKFATDGEFRRRSYHSYFYRQLGDSASTRSAARTPRAARPATARRAAGRADQEPRALDQADQRRRFRVPPRAHRAHAEDHHPRPLRAAFPRRRRRRARQRLPRPRSVLGRHGRGVRPGAHGAGRGRLPLRADRRDRLRQVRRSRRAGGACRRAATTGAR